MIKFLDIQRITDSYEPELSSAIQRTIRRGWFLLGEEVQAFEKEYSQFIGSKHCIGVANGLDALRLIFRTYIEMGHMREGDEVIVPANTYIASILAISDNRLIPILAEPDIETCNLDIYRIEKLITPRTKGLMVVHLYGQSCWSKKLEEIAAKYHLKIIEDNAQAAGAIVSDAQISNFSQRTGSLGHSAGHSFYPGKNLAALGDAGAITTNDDEFAFVLRAMANYGSSKKYVHDYQGLNSRLDEIQAAVLRIKLPRLDYDNQNRREIAGIYLKNIVNSKIILPKISDHMAVAEDFRNVWHLFVIRSKYRSLLQERLSDANIQTLIHYPIPPHKQKAYKELNSLSLPVTEKLHNEVLSLPISQVMSREETEYIVNIVNSFKID